MSEWLNLIKAAVRPKRRNSYLARVYKDYVERRPPVILRTCDAAGVKGLVVKYLGKYDVELDVMGGSITVSVLQHGHYQYDLMKTLAGLLPHNDLLFVNVGANVGTTCINAYDVGFRQFFAVEPVKQNFERLRMNCCRNNIDANLVKCAISDFIGAGIIHLHPSSSGQHSAKICHEPDLTERVDFSTLDYTLHKYLPVKKFLWIDVEGSELDVLSGGLDTLEHQSCIGLCIEISPYISGAEASLRTIEMIGDFFSAFYLRNGEKISLAWVKKEVADGRLVHFDLLAFK